MDSLTKSRVEHEPWSNRSVTEYRESLRPGVGVYLVVALVLPIGILTAAPFSVVFGVVVSVTVFVGICAALALSAPRIEVSSTTLRVGKARIERRYLGAISAYSGAPARAERGVNLDARAWTLFRGYIDPVVKIEITDPNDPTPYWLVSTRNALELTKVLRKR